jgi:ATP-dependent Clp protease ATP-binding subunit ClpA
MPELLQEITLSDVLKRTIKIAQAYAKENMHTAFSPAHLLKALLHKDAALQPLLKQLNKDIYYIEEWAEVRIETIAKTTSMPDAINADAVIAEVVNEADSIRIKLKKDSIETLHVLAAICTPGVAFTYEQLKTFPLRREELITTAADDDEISTALQNGHAVNGQIKNETGQHALLKYCIDKSLLAKQGKLDAIIGRDKEIRMVAEILTRRSKPNVLIAGEPGVGKTALVDGFALAILEKNVPNNLYNANVFELDTGALIAGASYKGEIEDRLKNILKEIKQFEKAILFIDELHVLLDKHGAAHGTANLLKPELARGEITVIGATTLDEYRKHIETDEAFNRRFELLVVEEPPAEICFHMLKAIMPYYEKHHAISIPDDTIKETIRLSKRYVKDRRLPDAAIDLADRSLAALRMINDTGSKDILRLKEKYDTWCSEDQTSEVHILEDWQWFYREITNKLSPILLAHIQSEDDPAKLNDTGKLKDYLSQALDNLLLAAVYNHTSLETSDVAAIISYKTGIPIGKVKTQEKERLLNMDATLKQRVVGQDHAIKSISEAVLESRSGLNKQGQPIGSFFFLGPTGTGKTELAKSLAEFLFQDESFMIRFDMSEFKEEHAAALLYGAPPGYVGYEEGGLLVNKIRQQPYSIVLFDEIEKAHSSVFDIFLQIMDEGKLHDKLGKEGDFSNALIIFTSNIGSQYVSESFNSGEIPSSNKLMETMSHHFRPEFLGRLTEIIPFAPMTEQMILNILGIQLKSLYTALDKQGINLSVTDAALKQLASAGYTPKYGARPLAGVIRNMLRRPLSRKIISGELCSGASVLLDAHENNELQWKIIENKR